MEGSGGSAASPASPPSPPPSSSSSSSASPLRPLISSTRSLLQSSAGRVLDGESSAVLFYNGRIVGEGNRQLEGLRGGLHSVRHSYGGPVVAASVATAAALSVPYGRFAVLRNAALVGLLAGWIAFPATVTGLLAVSAESVQSSPSLAPAWTRRGEEVVRTTERMPGAFSSAGNAHHLPNIPDPATQRG